MSLAGTYEFFVRSPLGDQTGTFTVIPDASETAFTGKLEGSMGSADVSEGVIAGNTLTWQMNITFPMPMSLDCEAVVDGDQVSGAIKAGIFGSMPLTGKRLADTASGGEAGA